MKQLAKIFITGVVMLCLSGCDDKANTDNQNTVMQKNAIPANSVNPQKLELLGGKFSLLVPVNMQDKGGQLSGQANNMHVFANQAGSENLITLTTEADEANVQVLIETMENQYYTRDKNAKVVIKQPITFADHSGWRLDVISYTKGKPVYNAILMTIVEDQLVTIQMAVTDNVEIKHTETQKPPIIVEEVINSIVIQ